MCLQLAALFPFLAFHFAFIFELRECFSVVCSDFLWRFPSDNSSRKVKTRSDYLFWLTFHRYSPAGRAENCSFPSNFCLCCESLTLPRFLNWEETGHPIVVQAVTVSHPFPASTGTWTFNPKDLRIWRVADSLSFTLISGICTMPWRHRLHLLNWHKIGQQLRWYFTGFSLTTISCTWL